MIYLFYGDDRTRIATENAKILGDDYETLDGAKIDPAEIPSLFLGTSLFAANRRILIRGLLENSEILAKLPDFTGTRHTIVLSELKFDKRSATAKALAKAKNVEVREFKLPAPDTRAVFNILNTAVYDGRRAVQLLDSIIDFQDPFQLVGLFATQAVKNFAERPTAKNRRILKSLAQLDLDLKSSPIEPWLLVKSWLLRIAGP